MNKQAGRKRAEAPKTLNIDTVEAVAEKSGMTLSELLEYGLYSVLETYDGKNNPISDAKGELEKLRAKEGEIPNQFIPSNPLARFATDAGLSFDELNELALLAAISIMNSSEFPNERPVEILENYRREKKPLIPSFLHDRSNVHPFMERLFSSDLKAVHGATFGDLGSQHVELEHLFIKDCLQRAFDAKDWEDAICQLIPIERIIRYCPTLRNEAGAIRALIEAEDVLGDFCRAVRNT